LELACVIDLLTLAVLFTVKRVDSMLTEYTGLSFLSLQVPHEYVLMEKFMTCGMLVADSAVGMKTSGRKNRPLVFST
jgi:hypothetical protein